MVGRYGLIASRIYERRNDDRLTIEFLSHTNASESYNKIDFLKPESFDYNSIASTDTIALLGAMSMPDACEKNPEIAHAVNASGPIYFVEKALQRGAKIIFASSDIVYGEREYPVYEDSSTAPVGLYGFMKSNVEKHFDNDKSFKSMRLSLVYSRDDKFTKYIASCATNGRTADIYHPIYRSVIHIDDVVDTIKSIALTWDSINWSIINMAGPHLLSRLDIAEVHKSVLWHELEITTVYPGDDFYHARPKTINMKSKYLENILGRPPRAIVDAVRIEFMPERRRNGV